MKRVTIFGVVTALAFALLSTWLGPKMIGWYVTPADQPAAMSCQAAVVGAMHRLVQTQLIATAIGFAGGMVLGIVFRRKKPPVSAPATQPVAPPTTAAKP